MKLNLVLVAVLVSYATFAVDITFKKAGKDLKKISLDELKAKVPAVELQVKEGHEGNRLVTFRGVPLKKVLDLVYGADWRKSEEALFTCLDGYKPSVPLNKIDRNDPVLAYERSDKTPFKFKDKDKETEYGPLYLVWDNLTNDEMKLEGMEFWPYQLVMVDLIMFNERFPLLAPPKTASAAAKRGFSHFRTQCLQCHQMNGQGGEKGIELNFPQNVTEYMTIPGLKAWIDDPTKVRANATMPPVNKDYKNRKVMIDEIVEYLKAMKSNKVQPKA